ncbi:RNA polymerase subunit sigma-70 [Bacillus canaveralius]|uniref:RNA polymerase subunit sigma-70 n=1 Tax=Bacillus canaveralius TaxID=1403243 RepID=A0A2N5GHP4_9BACI|nr:MULTISPECIES: sigma-70 family RNA polymerase sigma factor [Bacillus]PLR80334.1 RNA polymerase subunit sigma-70 [Bacillus canaveralius]PLR85818.1 RNA polymerase subunit sigma-70 [Bacillus sp. V33-4]PLR95447.1 RNA polymerase subunit sigma-70 [Bacillus canaveralius]RSK48701.1 sigma-70 family RNA polymerase sigma factor [Bacillus canaveralius]
MKITENNVVQQIQNKNEKAIPFIINQYGGLLTAIIKHHLNYHQQDYEECLDDVLLSIWNNIHSFDPEKNSFKQWIAAIAKYKAIDYQRRQIIIQNQQFSVADINESMLKTKQSIETKSVEELLEQLSASERKIFEKYYLDGTPSSEIAKGFNAKESWVYNKLSRGRKKLKKFLIQKNEV